MLAQALVACAILLTFPRRRSRSASARSALVAIYPFAKRFTWWPQVFLGLAFNWGALLAWAAHARGLALAPLLLYAAGIAWTLFYDTIYAHQDREDDALIGVKSTARLFGERHQALARGLPRGGDGARRRRGARRRPRRRGARGGAPRRARASPLHLAWQLRRLDIDDPDGCLRLFRSNRDAGLVLAGGLLARRNSVTARSP